MTRWLIGYVCGAAVFVALDFVWLSSTGQGLYRPALKELFATELRYMPAIAFYLVYPAGIVALAIMPAVQANSTLTAAALGAVLGLVAYATYNLTNMTTLKVWPLHLAVLDMAWGTFVTAVAAALGCWAMLRAAS